MRHGHKFNKEIATASRHIVARKYNITIETQHRIEKYIDSLNILQPLDIPEVVDSVHPDCRDYYLKYCMIAKPGFQYINFDKRKYSIWYDNILCVPF